MSLVGTARRKEGGGVGGAPWLAAIASVGAYALPFLPEE